MFRNFKIFKLFGVDVKFNWSWILLLLIWINLDSFGGVLIDLFTLLLITMFVLAHEYGHVFMARKYGVKIKQVVISVLGGAAFMDIDKLEPKQAIRVALAGPFVNLALLVVCLLLCWYTFKDVTLNPDDIFGSMTTWQEIVYISTLANGFMFIFNLIPIYPLDGGRVVRGVLENRRVRGGVFISIRIGQAFSLLLMVIAFWINSILLGVFVLFLFMMSVSEMKKLKREVIDYELGKIFQEQPNEKEMDLKVAELQKRVKDGSLFKETDLFER